MTSLLSHWVTQLDFLASGQLSDSGGGKEGRWERANAHTVSLEQDKLRQQVPPQGCHTLCRCISRQSQCVTCLTPHQLYSRQRSVCSSRHIHKYIHTYLAGHCGHVRGRLGAVEPRPRAVTPPELAPLLSEEAKVHPPVLGGGTGFNLVHRRRVGRVVSSHPPKSSRFQFNPPALTLPYLNPPRLPPLPPLPHPHVRCRSRRVPWWGHAEAAPEGPASHPLPPRSRGTAPQQGLKEPSAGGCRGHAH